MWVTNQGGQPLDTVTISFSRPYLLQFSNLTILPSPERPFDVPVTQLEPGATRLVRAEIQADHYGKHAGWIAATAGTGDTVRGDTLAFLESLDRPYLHKPFSLAELRGLLGEVARDTGAGVRRRDSRPLEALPET